MVQVADGLCKAREGTHSELVAGLEALGTGHDIHIASVEDLEARGKQAPHTLTKYNLIITGDGKKQGINFQRGDGKGGCHHESQN